MTNDLLKAELFPDTPAEEFANLIQKVRGILKSMASTDMDQTQAEAFLTSQTKKRDGGITEDLAKAFVKFWKLHKTRIHDCLIDECTWNHRLKGLSWRVDEKSRTRLVDQLNVPSAIVEMQLENRIVPNSKVEVVRFEIDEKRISDMIKNLNDVEELIAQHCGSPTAT